MRDSYDFDNYLMKMDRIGGSFTHLENELSDHLKPFRENINLKSQSDRYQMNIID